MKLNGKNYDEIIEALEQKNENNVNIIEKMNKKIGEDFIKNLKNINYYIPYRIIETIYDYGVELFYEKTLYNISIYGNNFFEKFSQIETNLKEIDALSKCNHPNVIKYYRCLSSSRTTDNFRYDRLEHESFGMLIEPFKCTFDDNYIYSFKKQDTFYQILCGLQHIMNNNMITCDLNPSNIVMFENGRVAIMNFELNVKNSSFENYHRLYYSYAYRPPELMLEKGYYLNEKSELWALGCTLYKIENKRKLFDDYEDLFENRIVPKNLKQYSKLFDNFTFSKNKKLDDLLRKLIVIDPEERISLQEALNHPYFNGVKLSKEFTIKERNLTPIQKLRRYEYMPTQRKNFESKILNSKLKIVKVLKVLPTKVSHEAIIFAISTIERLLDKINESEIRIYFIYAIYFYIKLENDMNTVKIWEEYILTEHRRLNNLFTLTNTNTVIMINKLDGIIFQSYSIDFLNYYKQYIISFSEEKFENAKMNCYIFSLLLYGKGYKSENVALTALYLENLELNIPFDRESIIHMDLEQKKYFDELKKKFK